MLRLVLLLTIAELYLPALSRAIPAPAPESSHFVQRPGSIPSSADSTLDSDGESAAKAHGNCPNKTIPGAHLDFAKKLNDCGEVARDRGDLANAMQYHRQALEIRQKLAPASLDLAESLNHLGEIEEQLGYLEKAEAHERKALEIRTKLARDSLAEADSLHSLGRAAMARGDLAQAELDFQQAFSIRQRVAPNGPDLAFSFIGLANLYGRRGNIEKQEEYFQQALDLGEKLTPANRAAIFQGLGNASLQRGQFAKAEEYSREALEIRQKLAPGSLVVAIDLSELGSIAQSRGNLTEAEKYFRQAINIDQKLAPGGLAVANTLQQLGAVMWLREDLSTAESYFRRALQIRQRLIPESPAVAQNLNWLGLVYARRGEVAQAEEYFDHALQISSRQSSDNLVASQMLSNLGDMAQRRNDVAKAVEYFQQALAIQQKLSPDSPGEAGTLQKLGHLEIRRHNLPEAEKCLRQALAIREKKMPGSLSHADVLLAMASVFRQEHKIDPAARMFQGAIDVLDQQMSNLGGSEEVRSAFRAKYETNYKNYADLLVADVKKPADAFNVVERSRARTLLELLESGRIDIHNGCSRELLRRQRSLRELISAKVSYRLELLDTEHARDTIAELDKQIEKLREQCEEVQTEIRLESPGYAELAQPRPLTAKEVQQQLLDVDTLLLEYSLADRRSYVWALTQTNVTVYPLPPRKVIESAARNVYELLTARSRRVPNETARQRRVRITKAEADYTKAASELSQMILGPVASKLEDKRLLIVSDGALQYLPFGALPIPRDQALKTQPKPPDVEDETNLPLVTEHEVVSLPSASALAELRRARINRKEPSKAVAVFADPVFDRRDERVARLRTVAGTQAAAGTFATTKDPSSSSQRLTRSATDVGLIRNRGEYLGRLLWTRREAAAILHVTPSGEGMQAIGFDANRSFATSPALAQYRIIHFATHALLDSKNPELSGLVLSLIDRDGRPQDGFLDLEQIYNLNLPADLVVLSACDTALGQEVRGEGLVGLARGFMYAGASRVMASLWSVDDEVTSELMARFYRHLEQDKMTPAAALRAAQLEVAKDKRWTAPYYWAGFQLQGEWK